MAGGPWPDHHGFLNKPHNPITGLTDVGARTYDPTTGRFQSIDPLLDTQDPQTWTGYTYANNNPTTFSDPTGLKYFVDDNNASIPRKQGHGIESPNDPVVARADQRANHNTRINAATKLGSPIQVNGRNVPVDVLERLRESHGYEGSDDFTYADGLAFAAKGNAQWDIFCQATGHSADECRYNPFTGNPDIHDMHLDEILLADLAVVAVAACIYAMQGCVLAFVQAAASGGEGGVPVPGSPAAARLAGIEGEALAGINQAAKVRIPSSTGTAAYRIPDELTATTLKEVKNVGSLSYTNQLRDFYEYSVSTGRSFELVVRQNTNLSQPLLAMEAAGQVRILRDLPVK